MISASDARKKTEDDTVIMRYVELKIKRAADCGRLSCTVVLENWLPSSEQVKGCINQLRRLGFEVSKIEQLGMEYKNLMTVDGTRMTIDWRLDANKNTA
jgi:hypothetical protein